MKDKILGIMQGVDKANADKHYENPDKRQKTSARLIADMVNAFTEWKDLNTMTDRITRYEVRYMLSDMDAPAEWITIDNLFNYWFDNIREK